MKIIKLFAPAKINLLLDVIGRLPNGYHQICSVMQTLNFGDYLTIKLNTSGKITLSSNCSNIPLDERNIAHKAAVAFLKELNSAHGAEIFIEKHTPAMAGLGGGSADGAAVLVGLNTLFEKTFSTAQLMRIGEAVGADIPFLVVGGTCLVEGIGEKVTPLSPLPQCFIALAKPNVGVSTKACFEEYSKNHSQYRVTRSLPLEALEKGDLETFSAGIFNLLEPAANLAEVESIKKHAMACGALAACMTGTGSTVFAIFTNEAAAKKHLQGMSSMGFWTMPTEPNSQGIKILP